MASQKRFLALSPSLRTSKSCCYPENRCALKAKSKCTFLWCFRPSDSWPFWTPFRPWSPELLENIGESGMQSDTGQTTLETKGEFPKPLGNWRKMLSSTCSCLLSSCSVNSPSLTSSSTNFPSPTFSNASSSLASSAQSSPSPTSASSNSFLLQPLPLKVRHLYIILQALLLTLLLL